MKKKSRWNRFDLLVLTLLLSVLAVLGAHGVRRIAAPEQAEVILTLRLRAVLPEIADALDNAETLSLEGGFPLDALQLSREPAALSLSRPDGSRIVCRSALREDVLLRVRAVGCFTQDGFLLGSKRPISPGMSLSLGGRDLALFAELLLIEPPSS